MRRYWDPEEARVKYHGQELTIWEPIRPLSMGTTHKHDFQGLGRKNAFPHHNKHPPKPEHKFEGDSTYNLTYKKWPTQPIYQHPSPLVARSYPGMWHTTANTSYQYPTPKERGPSRRERPVAESKPFEVLSTMMADYKAWPLNVERQRPPTAPEASPLAFTGSSVATEAYKWPLKDRTRPKNMKDPKGPPQAFEGESEYTAKYVKVRLPAGMPCSLGMQIASKAYAEGGVGGQFLTMIPAGTGTPMVATQTLTTAMHQQEAGRIVVIAKRDGDLDGIELGYFTMDALRPAKYGTQQVTVTFKLASEQLLQCSAYYKQGNRKVNLSFKDRAPLRSVSAPDI